LHTYAPMDADALEILQNAGEDFYQQALDAWLALSEPDWKSWMSDVKAKTGCKGKGLFMPLRVALSGATHGPDMSSIVTFLGRDGITDRIESARKLAAGN